LTVARSKISAREYKVLLRADRFSGDEIAIADAAAAFWRGLRGASEGIVLDVDGGLAVGERRLIRFYDTPDLCLRRNDYIFRERIDAASGRREAMLKFRHPDRYFAASRDLISEGGGQTKFEEDIKIPFQGLYSHSTTLAIGRDKRLDRLNDPGRLFPGLPGQFDRYDGSKPIEPVGGLTVHELVLTGAGFGSAGARRSRRNAR
jgi:hypothetical protein